jgi:hypothetical protein
VEDLSRRLAEVEKQRLALHQEVTAKSAELSATAKRWVEEISALDRGLAGEFFAFFLSFPLPAFGWRLSASVDSRQRKLGFFAISIFGLGAVGSCRLPLVFL